MSESRFATWQRAPGDAKAFTAWYRSVFPSLLYRASAVVGHDMEAARELLQEQLVRLLERGDVTRLRGSREAEQFLLTGVRHRWIDERRQRDREHSLAEEDLPSTDGEPPIGWFDLERRLARAAERLEPEERALLERLVEGAELADIAEAYDIAYGTAAVRVHRLRARLRALAPP